MKKVFMLLSVLILYLIVPASAQDKVPVNDLEQYISNSKSDTIKVVVTGVTDENQELLNAALRRCGKPLCMELASDKKLTYIYEAFKDCNSLISIVIPEGIKYIEENTFSDCQALENVVLPASVRYFSMAFYDCKSLKSVTIKEGVFRISMFAFHGCSSLKTVSLPQSLVWIDERAFEGCSSLESINIPDGVLSVDFTAFEGCTSLSELNVPRSAGWGKSRYENGHIRVVEFLLGRYECSYAFSDFEGLEYLDTVVFPKGIESIYMRFNDCKSLKTVVIPDDITFIPFDAFEGCTSLVLLRMPESADWGEYKYENGYVRSFELPDFYTTINSFDIDRIKDCKYLESLFVSKKLYKKYHKKLPVLKIKE